MGEAYFESTMDEYQMGNYAEAVKGFKRFLALAPHDFNGHYLLAHSLRFLGRYGEALEYYEKALLIKPDDYDAHMYAGDLYCRTGDPGKAEIHFNHALEVLPGDVDAIAGLGTVKRLRGDITGALELYGKTLDADPDHTGALVGKGICLREQGGPEKAIDILNRALAGAAKDYDALMETAKIRLVLKQPVEAAALFECAAKARPVLPEPYDGLAETAAMRGDMDAEKEYRTRADSLRAVLNGESR